MNSARIGLAFLSFASFACTVAPRTVGAWGSGHDDLMREVLERCRPELRATFTPEIEDKAIRDWSHYPDSFEPFLAEDVGEAALERLAAVGVKVRYDLHSERGMASAFIELIASLRSEDAARTALWISSLSHVIADMSASNHDPVVHTATYGWADWNLKLPGGKADFSALKPFLDLSGTARDDAGADVFSLAISEQILPDDPRSPETALVEIMLYGQKGAAYCSERGVSILEGAVGWVDRGDPSSRKQLWRSIGELGAWAVVRTLRDLEVAERFAKEGPLPSITPEIEELYRKELETFQWGRRLDEEALFAPVLQDPQPGKPPAVGVVLEPCWAMNGAMFGFSSRVQSVAIARTLKDSGRSYATLDVRDLLREGFPDSATVPLVVVTAATFRSYHALKAEEFDEHLDRYLAGGGRVLWIFGTGSPPPKSFASFRKAMQRRDDKSRLPLADDAFVGATLEASGMDLTPLRIARPAKTAAGWQQPYAPWSYQFSDPSDLAPFAVLRSGMESHVVGAVSADRKRLCLPIYALTPHLFEGGGAMPHPHEPALDPASRSLFFATLDLLLPPPRI